MDNLVNLEQLDYRDQLIKEYIDEHSSGGGGGGSLWCELEVTQDRSINDGPRGHLYMKCCKGTILETDELQFARKRGTQTYRRYDENEDRFYNVKRRAGWIIPRNVNYIHLYMVLDETKSSADPIYDYWEILPKNKAGENSDWETFIDEFLRQRHDNIDPDMWENYDDGAPVPLDGSRHFYNYACIFHKWAGVAVKREGKLISDYKEFMLVCPFKGNQDSFPSFQFRTQYDIYGRFMNGGSQYACGFLLKK